MPEENKSTSAANPTQELLHQALDESQLKYEKEESPDPEGRYDLFLTTYNDLAFGLLGINNVLHVRLHLLTVSRWETEKLSKVKETINSLNAYGLSLFYWIDNDNDDVDFEMSRAYPLREEQPSRGEYLKWALHTMYRGVGSFFTELKQKGVEP